MNEVRAAHLEDIELRSPADTIVLERLRIEDAEAYLEGVDADRPHLSQHGNDTADKYPDLAAVQANLVERTQDEYRFGIWDHEMMVGTVKIRKNKEGEFETGSWVRGDQTGHNYAARARQILLGFAFGQLGLDKVVSKVTVGNVASRISVERSGYRYVGQDHSNWLFEITADEFMKHAEAVNASDLQND